MSQSSVALKILKDLIAIPSYVGEGNPLNENGVVDYIEKWVQANTDFKVERQSLEGNRYNLIVKSGEPRTLFLAHTDTVAPSFNAKHDQLEPIEIDGELWGRGATDMKSGIATLMSALLNPSAEKKNFWIVFYADEEYDFLGLKSFVQKYNEIRPSLIISADGSDLQVGTGCRGLIEMRIRIKGETGHPAKETGKSAIKGAMSVLLELEKYLSSFEHEILGKSPLNIAYILGGAEKPESYKESVLLNVGKAGNVVPDICEFIIDIRPAVAELRAVVVEDFLKEKCLQKGLGYETVTITHDLGSWYTQKNEIEKETSVVRNQLGMCSLSNPNESGYIDLQMAWEQYDRPPALTFGSGVGLTAHKPDERIKIADLIDGEKVYRSFMDIIS